MENNTTTALSPILIFKGIERLPNAFKYLTEYLPQSREKVIVRSAEQQGENIYVKVKCKKGTFTLHIKHFWEPRKFKLINHFEQQPQKTEKQQKILNRLLEN